MKFIIVSLPSIIHWKRQTALSVACLFPGKHIYSMKMRFPLNNFTVGRERKACRFYSRPYLSRRQHRFATLLFHHPYTHALHIEPGKKFSVQHTRIGTYIQSHPLGSRQQQYQRQNNSSFLNMQQKCFSTVKICLWCAIHIYKKDIRNHIYCICISCG